jgi:excinuclease ABC subunit B
MTKEQIQKSIQNIKKQMEVAVKDLDFMEAARLRDEMFAFQKML